MRRAWALALLVASCGGDPVAPKHVQPTSISAPAIDASAAPSDAGRAAVSTTNDAGARDASSLDASAIGHVFSVISIGGGFGCGIENGDVWCWGTIGGGTHPAALDSRVPVKMKVPEPAIEVASGSEHACALGRSGKAWCWGDNLAGQLGRTDGDEATPGLVAGVADAVKIAAGTGSSCVISRDKTVACWGAFNDASAVRAKPVVGLTRVAKIAVGGHACALDESGAVSCWGSNNVAQLGDGTEDDRKRPVRVKGVSGAVDIAAGDRHSCAIVSGARVFCWGDSGYGESGTSNAGCKKHWEDAIPCVRPAARVSSLEPAQSFALGAAHSCAKLRDGTVRCIGDDRDGRLGRDDENAPVRVDGTIVDHVRSISAGFATTCVLREDGAMKCWGPPLE